MNKSPRKIILAVAVAAAFIVPIVYVLTPVPLPAQTPPSGLQAGHARIFYGTRPIWRAVNAEPVAAVQLAVPPTAPTWAGMDVFHWSAWYRAPATGSYRLNASITGGVQPLADVRVHVNGQRTAANAKAGCRPWMKGCPAATTTATGEIRLAAGWHEISLDATAAAGGCRHATVALLVRAPGTAAAVPLVPYWPAPAAVAMAMAK